MEVIQFPLNLHLQDAPWRAAVVTCFSAMRHLPAKRLVCLATWEGELVVAKLLFHRRKSTSHWLRQEKTIWPLISRGIAVPLPLYSGRYQSDQPYPPGGHCIITHHIPGGVTLQEAWGKAATIQEHQGLLERMMVLLASLHQKGIFQKDLHFGNFLLQGSKIHVLDCDACVVKDRPLEKHVSLDNLGLFFAQLVPACDDWMPGLLESYARVRGWQAGEAEMHALQKSLGRHRNRRQKMLLKKVFRESTAYSCIRTWSLYAVYSRTVDSLRESQLIRDPDSLAQERERGNLKRGNTSTVTLTSVGGDELVIKRYNIKSFFHGLSRAARKTRAASSWEHAHRLALLGVATAPPVAVVEKRIGPIRRESFYISSYVSGMTCQDFFRDLRVSAGMKQRAAERIADVFAILARHQISHGDLKATNILITDDQVCFVDLDAMREHRSKRTFQQAFRRDIERFMRNWVDLPEVRELFSDKLKGLVVAYE